MRTWMTWRWDLFCAGDTTLSLSQCTQGCELCVQKCEQFCDQLNGNTLPTGKKDNKKETVQRHSFFVFSHMLGTSSSDRFQHGPFTNVSGQWSRFSRFAVAHAWLFARNELLTEDGDLQSLWPVSSENVLVNLLLLHCGHCLWDWTFPHLSRKQQTNVCTDYHNETILVVKSCSVISAPAGRSHMLKVRMCVCTSSFSPVALQKTHHSAQVSRPQTWPS